jgi:hypothetical protein
MSAQTGAITLQTNYAAQWESDERPAIAGNQLFAWDGYYGGFSAWTTSTLARQWNDSGSIYNPPLAALDSTYVYAYGNNVYLRSNGAQQASIVGPTGLSSITDPMVSGSGRVLFDAQNDPSYPSAWGVAAYDGTSHQLLWTASTPAAVRYKAVGNGIVAVTAGQQLILLNEATGAPLRTWQAPGSLITSQLVLTRTHAFVEVSGSGVAWVYAINLATGQPDWSFQNTVLNQSGAASFDMAFGGGHLLLSHDNFVRAFTVPAFSAIVDNGQAGFSEAGPDWTPYTGTGYNNNLDYAPAGTGADTATWQVGSLPAGSYDVQMTWNVVSNHATNATYQVYDGSTLLKNVTVNQQQAPSGSTANGTAFQSLGLFPVSSGTLKVVLSNNANGYVIADAARIVSVPAAPQVQVTAGSQAVSYNGSFAMSALVGQAASQTFTVTNTGGATLTLTDPISLPTGFTLASDFGSTSLAPGQSTTFVVQMNTAKAASPSGTVSFGTNVSGENPFSFTLRGTVATFVIMDNGQAGFSESGTGWTQYTGAGYNSTLDYAAAGTGSNTASWQLTGLASGNYAVQMTWTAVANHATNATYSVYDGSTLLGNFAVNQQQAPAANFRAGDSNFQSLGTFQVNSGTLTVTLTDNANGYVIADAAHIVAVPAAPQIQVSAGTWTIYYNYSFPMSALVGQAASQTFTVTNTGGAILTLADPISLPTGFTLASDFGSTSLAPGQSTTFAVNMNTAQAASYSGTVSFGTNVSGTNPFQFVLNGTVTTSALIDNGQAGFSESGSGWTHYTGAGYNNIVDYAAAGTGGNTASWQLTGLASGTYDAQVTWTAVFNHATNATYSVYDGNTLLGTFTVNQQQAPTGTTVNGSVFQSLGLFQVSSGTLTVTLTDNANGYVIADAFRALVS